MMSRKKENILIVSHDAGGAELVSTYVKNNLHNYNFFCVVEGPAKKIFLKKGLGKFLISGKNIKNVFDVNKFSYVILSIGWASDLEHRFLRFAKKLGVKTVVYLDHWVNYRERFGFPRKEWKKNLPDEIWIGDKHAFEIAKKLFSNYVSKIKLVPNINFRDLKNRYNSIYKKNKKSNSVLFIGEPMSEAINVFDDKNKFGFDEYFILDEILKYLEKKDFNKEIIIRLHPSEKKNKYDKIIKKYKNKLVIKKSNNKDLLLDFSLVKYVIGMESMALYEALLCGKNVISFFPTNRQKYSLPVSKISIIKKASELKNILS